MRQSITGHRQDGGAVLWMMAWVLGMAAILYFCLTFHWPQVQARLHNNVAQALAPMGVANSDIAITDGRDVSITGSADTEAMLQSILDTAENVQGVRTVISGLTVAAVNSKVIDTVDQSTLDAPADSDSANSESAENSPSDTVENTPAPDQGSQEQTDSENASEQLEVTPVSADANGAGLAEPSLHLVSTTDSIIVAGQVADEATANRFQQAVTGIWPDTIIDNQLTLDSKTAEPLWLDSALKTLPILATLENAELHISNNTAEVQGTARTQADTDLMEQSLAEHFPLPFKVQNSIQLVNLPEPEARTLESGNVEPEKKEPEKKEPEKKESPHLKIELADGTLRLSGSLNNTTELERVVGSALAAFDPDLVENEISIEGNVRPANWITPLSNTLNGARLAKTIAIEIDNKNINLNGEVSDEGSRATIGRIIKREFSEKLNVTEQFSIIEESVTETATQPTSQQLSVTENRAAESTSVSEGVEEATNTQQQALEERPADTSGSGSAADFAASLDAINTRGILFESSRDRITSSSAEILEQIVSLLKKYPNQTITIAGYTDSSGRAEDNKVLSQARADAVQAFLINQGIAASRLKAFGYGEVAPIADNTTAAGRAKNRRIEFND